ncbi:28S rRNA (cytosine-C(5))-methyltransferase isoform X1 [Procambarus clarkii]|uniref:28S rRNA (cytosine-C(5))-methyltransferase isoform X1 n=2 Tax=Procambarus clarkii TaxID=6728 RepID=UPI003742B968
MRSWGPDVVCAAAPDTVCATAPVWISATTRTMGDKRQHSIPVPRLYKEASKILRQYENKEGSLKTLVYKGKYKNYKRIYGLLCKTVENSAAIKTALAESNLYIKESKFDPYLAQVLTQEMLGKGLLGDCRPILTLLKYEDKIRSLMSSCHFKQSSHEKRECSPRYVRVNTLKTSMSDVQFQLDSEGWIFQEYDSAQVTYDDFLCLINNLEESTYLRDYHIPDLLIFPPNTPFWDSILYECNAVILQDKASCLPVFLSSLKSGANVIDACAAPGNKTSYIAAAISDNGHVLAVEKDFERYQTLQKLLNERGTTCVTFLNKDFTKLLHDKHSDVEFIFVDPSCSSSGLSLHNDEIPEQRIRSLAAFQVCILLHALSFPSVKEVIYSTCSVNIEENEEVIQEALKRFNHQFELENLGQKLPGWKHFGNENFVFGEKCLRTRTDVDKCHGFFVAKFVRKVTEHNVAINSSFSLHKKEKKRKHKRNVNDTAIMLLDGENSDAACPRRKKQRGKNIKELHNKNDEH